MKYGNMVDMVGNTPSLKFATSEDGSWSLFAKLEGHNPSGSIKDRACAYMIRRAIETGELTEGKTLIDSSSGNFACAMAFYGAMLGYPCEVAVSSKLTVEKRRFLHYLRATMHEVGNFTIDGNRFCRELARKNPSKFCFLDQLHNWQNPQAHYETTAPEIIAEFPDLAMIVGSLGSGGTMTGIAQYIREMAPHVILVAVECASGDRIPGIGSFNDGDYVTPFIAKSRKSRYFDHTVQVTVQNAITTTRFAAELGIFGGLQTGGVLHAALQSAETLRVKGSVVALSGDTGWKNLDRLVQS